MVYKSYHINNSKMKDGLFPWSDLIVQLSWSDFFLNQFTKPLGPSLAVTRMWIKNNDRVSKSECADFFLIYAVKRQY